MNAIVKTCIFLSALVAYVTADCKSNCESQCNVISAACSAMPMADQLGVNCTAIGGGCTATCDTQFCPCIAAAGAACVQARDGCRTDSGNVDFMCHIEFNLCVSSGTASCHGEIGANTIAGTIQTVGQMFQGMGRK